MTFQQWIADRASALTLVLLASVLYGGHDGLIIFVIGLFFVIIAQD